MKNTSEAGRERILMICERKGITVNYLTTICDINPSTLQGIMSGKNGASIFTIERICMGMNYTFADFFSTKALLRLPSYPAKKKVTKNQENKAEVEQENNIVGESVIKVADEA